MSSSLWLALFDDLAERRNASGRLGPETAYLLPDRSLSPAAARRFKDLRSVLYREIGRPWPSPSVFLFPELAKRILRLGTEFAGLPTLDRPACPRLDVLLGLTETSEDPRGLRFRLERAEELATFGVPLALWARLAGELLSGDFESAAFTPILTTYLQAQAFARERGELFSPWDQCATAADFLVSRALPPSFFARLFELQPGDAPARVVVPAVKELFADEERLLAALGRHLKVERLEAPDDVAPFLAHEVAELDAPSRADEDLFWAFREPKPRASLLLEILPDSLRWDLSEGASRLSSQVRRLRLLADFEARDRPEDHPLHRPGEENASFDVEALLLELVDEKGLPVEAALQLRSRLEDPLVRGPWLEVLQDEGWLESDEETASDPRSHATGPSVFPLEDLAWVGASEATLWTRAESLEKLLSPLSPETRARRLVPREVETWLAAEGVRLPDPSREAPALARWLAALRPRLRLFRREVPRFDAREVNFGTRESPARPESASGLEAVLTCPRRYYISRRLRLEDPEGWDSEDLSPLKRGNWIHRVLELFFVRAGDDDWRVPRALLEALFLETLAKEAGERSTPGHQNYLRNYIPSYLRALTRHVNEFEAPLRDLAGPRRVLSEFAFAPCDTNGFSLRGRIDRIDLYEGGFGLWDYKTGSLPAATLKGLVNAGQIQWALYRRLLESGRLAAAPAQGELPAPSAPLEAGRFWVGGYLQPLDPSRSVLFVGPDAPGPVHELFTRSLSARYRVTIPKEEDWRQAEAQLDASLAEIRARLDRGDFAPEPRQATACDRCHVVALCGRPDLSRETRA